MKVVAYQCDVCGEQHKAKDMLYSGKFKADKEEQDSFWRVVNRCTVDPSTPSKSASAFIELDICKKCVERFTKIT